MPFEYDKNDPIIGPLAEFFKQVNGREPEDHDIALYCPYIPLHVTDPRGGVYHDGQYFKDYAEWRLHYDDNGKKRTDELPNTSEEVH